MDDNLEELLEVVYLCKRLKGEKVLFQPVVIDNTDQTERAENFPGFVSRERIKVLDKVIDQLIRYKKRSLSNFDFIGNSIRHLQLIKRYFRGHLKPRSFPCYAGYNRLQIVQEGKVYFCVPQQKFETNFGDIKKDSLKDLWYSGNAKFYRKLIKKCKSPCLQWCSYRDGFVELLGFFQKKLIF
jgi:radical SAM protein with 4Fe4S-binding SPASM domain